MNVALRKQALSLVHSLGESILIFRELLRSRRASWASLEGPEYIIIARGGGIGENPR